MRGKSARSLGLLRFVMRKGYLPKEALLLGRKVPFKEVRICKKGSSTVSVYELGKGDDGFLTLERSKGKAKISIWWNENGLAFRESLRYISDIIIEICPSFKRAYVVRSTTYEGFVLADKVWKWLRLGHSGKVVWLEGPEEVLKGLEGFVYNACTERFEGPRRNYLRLPEEVREEIRAYDFCGNLVAEEPL